MEAFKKGITIGFTWVLALVLLIIIAGYIKFWVLADDIYVEDSQGNIVRYNDLSEEELKLQEVPKEDREVSK